MGLFLVILVCVIGFFVFLSWLFSYADRRYPMSMIMVTALLIYGCMLGILFALGQYLGELGLVLYAVSILYSCMYWGWKIIKAHKEKHKIQWGIMLTLLAYTWAVLYITIIMREGGSSARVQMEVLNWANNSAQNSGAESFQHILMNCIMFIPIGILYPFLYEQCRRKVYISAISFGLLLSVLIETCQLIFRYGTCDIDDILSNFLGTVIGTGIAGIWNKMKKHHYN